MANNFALRLARDGWAEMSCIAGVGGGVKPLLRVARQGRSILAIDGCALGCARDCLDGAGITTAVGLNLADFGVKKRRYADYCQEEAEHVWRTAILPAVGSLCM